MNETQPKPFVFVLMPFDKAFDDIYEVGIKAACKDAGAYCERVDEQIFQESILDRIYNQIGKADIVVADMTGRNPNVFYETGYAHALGKRVILLTQDGNDIPFDLKHYPHIVYAGRIKDLKAELEKRVRWYIDNPSQDTARIEFDLEIFVHGQPITNHPHIHCRWIWAHIIEGYGVAIQLDIHNPHTRIFKGICTLGLITAGIYKNLSGAKVVRLPDGRYQHLLGDVPQILPSGWESMSLILLPQSSTGEEVEGVAVVYTEAGIKEFPVLLRYPDRPPIT